MRVSAFVGKPNDERTYTGSSKVVLPSCLVGVEIEMEDFPEQDVPEPPYAKHMPELPFWEITKDNSLRGKFPHEYRFAFPLAGKDLVAALDILDEHIKNRIDYGSHPPVCSARTGLHIHINTLDMTVKQLFNQLLVYTAFEKMLYKYVGNDRENNIFCLPFYKAEHDLPQMGALRRILDGTGEPEEVALTIKNRMNKEHSKYAGFNFGVVFDKGSVEYRMMQGEWGAEPILQWVNIILCIKKYAMENDINPMEFHTHASKTGINKFIFDVFGKYAPLLRYPGDTKDVLDGIRLGQDILLSRENADAFWDIYAKNQGDSPFFQRFFEKHYKAPAPNADIKVAIAKAKKQMEAWQLYTTTAIAQQDNVVNSTISGVNFEAIPHVVGPENYDNENENMF